MDTQGLTRIASLSDRPQAMSAAVQAGPLLHVSGQIAQPSGADGLPYSTKDQLAYVLNNLDTIFQSAGTDRTNVAKLTCYLTDQADMSILRDGLTEWFGSTRPAVTAVVVSGLALPGLTIEVEAIALVPDKN